MKQIPLVAKKDGKPGPGEFVVVGFTKVDDDDYIRFGHLRFSLVKGYAVTSVKINGVHHNISLQRLIKNPPNNLRVDYRDGDKLNNTKNNLRVCNNTQNMQHRHGLPINNTTGILGVDWFKRDQKYRAQIRVNGKRIHIGTFDTLEAAAMARNKAAIKYFGEFAPDFES